MTTYIRATCVDGAVSLDLKSNKYMQQMYLLQMAMNLLLQQAFMQQAQTPSMRSMW